MDNSQPLHRRTLVGHPVDVATGIVFTAWEDFTIPGPFPLVWRRFYNTSYIEDGPFGKGWITPFSVKLKCVDNRLVFLNDDAAEVILEIPEDGERINHPGIQYETIRKGSRYIIWNWHHNQRFIFDIIQEKEEFRLVRVENQTGHGINLSYTGNRWTGLTDSGGRSFQVKYNVQNLVRAVILMPESADESPTIMVKYEYDRAGRLTAVYDRMNHAIHYVYDGDHRLVQETNRLGGSFHFEYDGQGRCIHNWGDGGFLERYLSYDSENRITTVTDSLGYVTIYETNEMGLVIKITNPIGAETKRVYDTFGRLVMEFNPLGHNISYSYDREGNPVSVIDTLGHETRYSYNSDHLVTEVVDSLGYCTTKEYNDNGKIVSVTDSTGAYWSVQYDEKGNLTALILPTGNRYTYESNRAGFTIREVFPSSDSQTYTFDRLGNMLSWTNADGRTTQYVYDVLGRLVCYEKPGEDAYEYKYDALGNLTEILQSGCLSAHFAYTVFGNMLFQEDALGGRVEYAYNSEGRLVEIKNQKGDTCALEYDALGRIVDYVDFSGFRQRFEYDVADRIIKRHLGASGWIEFRYDAKGNLIAKITSEGTTTAYAYNEAGRLVKAENKSGTVSFEYDAAGRLSREQQPHFTVEYGYTLLGQRAYLCSSSGMEFFYTYDANGRLTSLNLKDKHLTWQYSSSGLVTSQRNDELLETTYDYDIGGHLTAQTVANSSGEVILQRAHEFSTNGNLNRIIDKDWGVTEYQYDANKRLVGYSNTRGQYALDYDLDGNLIRHPLYGTSQFGPGDRITKCGKTKYIHDERGNIVQKQKGDEVIRYEYDLENQLQRVVMPDGRQVEFGYDPLKRRISKTIGGRTTVFGWDRFCLLHEKDEEDSIDYSFFPDSFRPLFMKKESQWYDFHTGRSGAVIGVTDGTGYIVWNAAYQPFSKPDIRSQSGFYTPFRYLGQYADLEIDLHYNMFRYYDPQLGRYTSTDPLGIDAGTNLYEYTINPVNWCDPLGLACNMPSEAETDARLFRRWLRSKTDPTRPLSDDAARHIVDTARNHGLPIRPNPPAAETHPGRGGLWATSAHIHVAGEHIPVLPGFTY